jgi:hypothetical protein
MHELDFLIGHRLKSVARRDYDWVFYFDGDACLVVHCLWRLIENDRICTTSNDDGHQFGLPAPVNAADRVNSRLAEIAVDSLELRDGLLDLQIHFGSEHTIQVVPDSAGYEAWDLCHKKQRFIAVGGGQLVTIVDGNPSTGSIIHGNG